MAVRFKFVGDKASESAGPAYIPGVPSRDITDADCKPKDQGGLGQDVIDLIEANAAQPDGVRIFEAAASASGRRGSARNEEE